MLHLRRAVIMLILFTVLTGIVYPLALTAIGHVAMASRANGSLVLKDGAVIGSSLIGQSFTSEKYFHGRPSATSAPDPSDVTKTIDAPYNAAQSSGSNLGPVSKKFIDRVTADTQELRRSTGSNAPVAADSVTTSASGIDPHISPAFAAMQVARVAKARGLPEDRVRKVLQNVTDQPFLGIFGEPRVNVLNLNLALDAEPAAPTG